jgi:hypothetical protein
MAMHESKHSEAQKRRGRLYRAIEDDIVELDHQLKNRIETLKSQRDIIVATLERMLRRRALTPRSLAASAESLAPNAGKAR